jgi:hypothetical protein
MHRFSAKKKKKKKKKALFFGALTRSVRNQTSNSIKKKM